MNECSSLLKNMRAAFLFSDLFDVQDFFNRKGHEEKESG